MKHLNDHQCANRALEVIGAWACAAGDIAVALMGDALKGGFGSPQSAYVEWAKLVDAEEYDESNQYTFADWLYAQPEYQYEWLSDRLCTMVVEQHREQVMVQIGLFTGHCDFSGAADIWLKAEDVHQKLMAEKSNKKEG